MTGGPVSDLAAMLAGMDPLLAEGSYSFVSLKPEDGLGASIHDPFAMIQEDEGVTFIVPTGTLRLLTPIVTEKDGVTQIRPADDHDLHDGLNPEFARITLQVHSDLEGVGLTAAVSTALAQAGISCNVIAAFHHDHLFVPWDRRDEAMDILKQLANDAGR